MIPGLWQCGDLAWWQQLLAFPLSAYGVLAAFGAGVAMKRSGYRRIGRALLRAGVWQLAVVASLAVLGGIGGVVVLKLGSGPSPIYNGVKWLWLLSGWVVVSGVALITLAPKRA